MKQSRQRTRGEAVGGLQVGWITLEGVGTGRVYISFKGCQAYDGRSRTLY